MSKTVLVVGGSGVFGSRLVERLACGMDCTVLIAGRSASRLEQHVQRLRERQLRATVRHVVLDRDCVSAAQLRALGVAIVVDAAGPFQGQVPHLARAAIAAGSHFIDLADARDYVAAFPQLDAQARAAGVLAVCGASSTPSLSHAVLEDLCAQLHADAASAFSEVAIAIAPGNRAPRGLAVVRAILSYVGQPLQVLEAGSLRARPGWSMLHRRRLSGLGRRWFSLCETPDLDLVPLRFASVRTAHFFAGLELGVLHCGLWALSLLVRAGLLRSLLPYATQLHAMAQRCERCGEDRGGMLVETCGWNASGARVHARWELIAEGGDGPCIPVLPALALLRRLLSRMEMRRGAMACAGVLTLQEILAEASGLRIVTRQHIQQVPSLFRRVLGSDFERMPAPIRALHTPRGTTVFRGVADIGAAAHRLGAWIARLFGFPPAASRIAVQVTIEPQVHGEIWRRRFGERSFASVLRCAGAETTEAFGPIRCVLRVVAHEHGLDISIERARLLGFIALPRFLSPWTRAHERIDEQGRFTFDVEIGLHGIGRLVHYRGWLVAAEHSS